jgi:hypothetical protein
MAEADLIWMHPRDIAKIGQLGLDQGCWKANKSSPRVGFGTATRVQIATYHGESHGLSNRLAADGPRARLQFRKQTSRVINSCSRKAEHNLQTHYRKQNHYSRKY